MSDYYKLIGHQQSETNWTTEVVLEVDDDGNPTKVVSAGVPDQLSAEDRGKLEELGFIVEKTTAAEAKEVAERGAQQPGSDIAGAAPVLGAGTSDDGGNDNDNSGSKKSGK